MHLAYGTRGSGWDFRTDPYFSVCHRVYSCNHFFGLQTLLVYLKRRDIDQNGIFKFSVSTLIFGNRHRRHYLTKIGFPKIFIFRILYHIFNSPFHRFCQVLKKASQRGISIQGTVPCEIRKLANIKDDTLIAPKREKVLLHKFERRLYNYSLYFDLRFIT